MFVEAGFDFPKESNEYKTCIDAFLPPFKFQDMCLTEKDRVKMKQLRETARDLLSWFEGMLSDEFNGIVTEVIANLKKGRPKDKFCYVKFGKAQLVSDYQTEKSQKRRALKIQNSETGSATHKQRTPGQDHQSPSPSRNHGDQVVSAEAGEFVHDDPACLTGDAKEAKIMEFRDKQAKKYVYAEYELVLKPSTILQWDQMLADSELYKNRKGFQSGEFLAFHCPGTQREPTGLLPNHSVAANPPATLGQALKNMIASLRKGMATPDAKD